MQLTNLILQLTSEAKKSNMNIKLAAGLFYSRKGFISMGYNSTRTYVDKSLISSMHAECAAIHNCKIQNRMKTRHLKLIVIRVSPSNKLLHSKPCIHCTCTIRDYGIKKIYYVNENNELSYERISDIEQFHKSYPSINHTDVWFDRVGGMTRVSSFIKQLQVADPISVGKDIARLRTERGWSQQDLSSRICLSLRMIQDIEKGTVVDFRIIVKFTRCFASTRP